ncbi:hypothetical protein Mapa_006156 [Marchantia paleacea]|nr:hypothetical protein Mapa_006156 [Marchantia paleacea]
MDHQRLSTSVTAKQITITRTYEDGGALLEFKRGILGDPLGRLSGWSPANLTNLCSWTGIFCSNCGRVMALVLSEERLNGSLSRSLGSLTYLVHLNLACNILTVTIRLEVGKLKNLEALNLEGNQLTGSLPNVLGNCSKLRLLAVSQHAYWEDTSRAPGYLQRWADCRLCKSCNSGRTNSTDLLLIRSVLAPSFDL